ncbi:primosomal protein N' [Stenoxybacter acetivorans]|uniref:primosomal protein N' n=1 Tax=Stenoxybacter acetivorans TaxID=422441 RepID=UPI00056C3BE7|nr:primosomal protein N' [Stenoxybacter acetivorans]
MTIYHHLALNVPLPHLFTYTHPVRLAEGTRVAVRFRGKLAVGIVWRCTDEADIDANKILPIETVFTNEMPFDRDWRLFLDFTARYYHYPLGQAVFAALPQVLRTPKAAVLPPLPLYYVLSELGLTQTPPPMRHQKTHALWQALSAAPRSISELKSIHTQAKKWIDTWLDNGWLKTEAPPQNVLPQSEYDLNEEQCSASDAVQAALGGFTSFLLHGITGSGKTEVYFDIMAAVLTSGKQVLFLLPEINLTPQLLTRLQRYFPNTPAVVLHSQTAAGERAHDYLRAQSQQASLIIGTRLAVFTPLPNLGLIVVDEEHDSSFKQESELRYHARDLAIWRAQQAACPIVLGSATPSLESWHKASRGQYRLFTLSRRARETAKPPQVRLLDTRRQLLDNGFSAPALQKLRDNFADGGMSMVYLNRRGFAPVLFCGDCGYVFGCPHCSAKLVLHQQARQLRCHHCGHRQPIPSICPDCGNQDLSAVGQGTQRAEDTLRALLPTASIERVDRDSTARKSDWANLYARIERNEIDVLVGTQMLAKGHDFARLNLVIVVNADGSLYSADFRSSERLFAELMQVAGRAGRADAIGEVWVQSQWPEHRVFQALQAQDYALFADEELRQRQEMGLPPFAYMAAIRADAPSAAEAQALLREVQAALQKPLAALTTVRQLGPVPMLMARLAGWERAQIFLESENRRDLHHAISLWQQGLTAAQKQHKKSRWLIDVDPLEM